MKRSSHCGKLIALVVLVSLVFAALTPTAAFAEGDIPEAPPAEAPPEVEEGVTEAVELLAESGAVIVQDGEPLPLASQGALDGLCDPDPWYYGAKCPSGICQYRWEDVGEGPYSLEHALDDWADNQGYGFITIEGYEVPYLLDHYPTIDALDGFGALKGFIGVQGPSGATPTINGSFTLYNFAAGFTVQGLVITSNTSDPGLKFVTTKGTIKIIDTELSGSTEEGLRIEDHKGAVELNRVSVHDNDKAGIFIDNCNKVVDSCGYVGPVKITNSTSFNNGLIATPAEGIYIISGGAITLNGVSAFGNNGTGLKANSYGSLTIKNSAFQNNRANIVNDYSLSRGFGIRTADDSRGNILLENVLVQGNGKSGMWLYTNTGSITLKKVQAIGNGLDTNNPERRYGVEIGDHDALYPAKKEGALNVTISDSLFTGNYSDNLRIHAKGAVILTNVLAIESETGFGVYIVNTYNNSLAPVMVVNSTFNLNKKSGLQILSNGVVTLNTFTASWNGEYGLLVNNTNSAARPVGITLLSTYGINRIQNNPLSTSTITKGAAFITLGNLTINNLEVFGHKEYGVSAQAYGSIIWKGGGAWDNTRKLSSGDMDTGGASLVVLGDYVKPVIVTNARFDQNTNGVGLYVFTQGPVTLTNISANNNGYDGVRSFNASSVSVLRTIPAGNNTFSNNGLVYTGGHGLYIMADKNVVLNRVEAIGNSGAGAMIQSEMGGSVTVTGTSNLPAEFSGNLGYHQGTSTSLHAGLEISAYGIKLTNIRASSNHGAGIFLSSWGSSVSILGTLNEFSGNSISAGWTTQQYGLWVDQAYGPVTILNFKADGNYGGGIHIDNTAGTGSVTLNSTVAGFTSSVTDGEGSYDGYGLEISSRGAVTINRVDISDGDQITPGAYINNTTSLTSMPVKVSLSSFNYNYGDGLHVESGGLISISKVIASGNKYTGGGTPDGNGLWLRNDNINNSQVYSPITIMNSVFNGNDGDGANIQSTNKITVSTVTANYNKGSGLIIELEDGLALPPAILITGKNQFIGNGNNGLEISGYGLVTVSGVEAGDNGGNGINVNTYKQVTISNSWLYQNWNGIYVEDAPVTISNVTSMGNGYYGLDVEGVPVGGKVKLLNSTFILNDAEGINIYFDDGIEGVDFIMINVNYFGNNGGGENYYIEY